MSIPANQARAISLEATTGNGANVDVDDINTARAANDNVVISYGISGQQLGSISTAGFTSRVLTNSAGRSVKVGSNERKLQNFWPVRGGFSDLRVDGLLLVSPLGARAMWSAFFGGCRSIKRKRARDNRPRPPLLHFADAEVDWLTGNSGPSMPRRLVCAPTAANFTNSQTSGDFR